MSDLAEYFADIVQHARAIRHDIHAHPELGYEERNTASIIRGELNRLGIPWQECTETGTLGRLAADAPGPHIALRADIDALPMQEENDPSYKSRIDGCMHACGHDGHAASLLGTAAWLKAHEDQLPGPVTLLFQPAEEGGAGARAMIEGGALAGIDQIYGYHNWPALPFGTAACQTGPMMASNGAFYITITGKGGHASQPERCIDTVLLGAQIVSAINTIPSRLQRPQDACVISITCFNAGTAVNIIPEHISIAGTIRAPTTALRDELRDRIRHCAHALAAATGAEAQLEWEPQYPATVNHATCAMQAEAALLDTPGITSIDNHSLPLMGSEDFSFYQEEIPGCYAIIGATHEGDTVEICHSPRFDYNDDLLPIVIGYFSRIVGAPKP